MTPIRHFEDMQAWQEARKLCQQVYLFTDQGSLAKDFGLKDQARRAAISVMANIAEGFDCESHPEFARFLGIARRSAVELQSLMYAALDIGYISRDDFNLYYAQAEKTKALISAFKRSLQR